MLAGVANSYSKAGLREVSLLRSLARAARSCAPAAFSSRCWVEGLGFRSIPTIDIHVKGDKER